MNTSNKSKIQGLEFLPLILIVVYKVIIQSNRSISHENKMLVLYGFIAISTVVFGYLLFDKKGSTTISKTSMIVLFSLILIVSVLFYLKS